MYKNKDRFVQNYLFNPAYFYKKFKYIIQPGNTARLNGKFLLRFNLHKQIYYRQIKTGVAPSLF